MNEIRSYTFNLIEQYLVMVQKTHNVKESCPRLQPRHVNVNRADNGHMTQSKQQTFCHLKFLSSILTFCPLLKSGPDLLRRICYAESNIREFTIFCLRFRVQISQNFLEFRIFIDVVFLGSTDTFTDVTVDTFTDVFTDTVVIFVDIFFVIFI